LELLPKGLYSLNITRLSLPIRQ